MIHFWKISLPRLLMVHTATILIDTESMLIRMAGGEGLEPSSTDLESIFLPIREPPRKFRVRRDSNSHHLRIRQKQCTVSLFFSIITVILHTQAFSKFKLLGKSLDRLSRFNKYTSINIIDNQFCLQALTDNQFNIIIGWIESGLLTNPREVKLALSDQHL